MSVVLTQTLTERFVYAVELVLRGFSLSLPRSPEVAPLAVGTWNRLKRLAARFAALVAAVEAGRLRTTGRSSGAGREPCAAPPERRLQAPAVKAPTPKAYGWLLSLAPELNTRIGRAQIEALLADPAMLALLAQAPRAGRILRPLCHMLRIALPECLKLPPRPRRRAKAADAPSVASVERPNRPPKPSWLRWPKSPPLPALERAPSDRPRHSTGAGPPDY